MGSLRILPHSQSHINPETKVTDDFKLVIVVNACLSLSVCPVIDWQPIQGVSSSDPELVKWLGKLMSKT